MLGKINSRGFVSLIGYGDFERSDGNLGRNVRKRFDFELNCMKIDGNLGCFQMENQRFRFEWRMRSFDRDNLAKIDNQDRLRPSNFVGLDSVDDTSSRIWSANEELRGGKIGLKLKCLRKDWNSDSGEFLDRDFGFEEEIEGVFSDSTLKLGRGEGNLSNKNDISGVDFDNSKSERNRNRNSSMSSSLDVLELKREGSAEEIMSSGAQENSRIVATEDSKTNDSETDGGGIVERLEKRRKQVVSRSMMLAKQVISMESALSMGFVSQLWVDTRSWVVLLVEVRPSMLSGEMERFLLQDVCKVGDVVLVHDESVTEHEFRMIGLDTLVGYNVMTSDQRNVGKVRGYSFDLDSGGMELLELDSIGLSIIPASLVSTYGLPVEDVIEVTSDTVVVHEDAPSRVQRLSKGLWDARNGLREYTDDRRRSIQSARRRRGHNISDKRYFPRKTRDSEVNWELPMDY